jgi:hypothetical protein
MNSQASLSRRNEALYRISRVRELTEIQLIEVGTSTSNIQRSIVFPFFGVDSSKTNVVGAKILRLSATWFRKRTAEWLLFYRTLAAK